MPTAEDLKARFETRIRPPGPTDEKLAATLGLAAPVVPDEAVPAAPSRPAPRHAAVKLVTVDDTADATVDEATETDRAAEGDGGGVGLDAVADMFPAPETLTAPGPEPVKVGFPVPVTLMRDVARLKVDLSRHLGRRLSNHELGTAAATLIPTDPATAATLLRRHAARIGLEPGDTPTPSRRLVASIPIGAAAQIEDVVLDIERAENVRVTKSQLWALGHVLLLERVGR